MCLRKSFAVVGVVVLLVAVSLTAGQNAQRSERPEKVYALDSPVRDAWVAKWEAQMDQNAAAWEAWRDDVKLAVETDEAYLAATDAVEAVPLNESLDPDAYEALVIATDEQYRRVALRIYEVHFGPWQGSESEFDVVLELASGGKNDRTIRECSDAAIYVCGKGKIKSVDVSEDGDCLILCDLSR